MKTKFHVTIVKSECWDALGSPNINVEGHAYDTIAEARKALTGVVREYSDPALYEIKRLDFHNDHFHMGCVKFPEAGHHDFPIKTAVYADISVVNGNGYLVATNMIPEKELLD